MVYYNFGGLVLEFLYAANENAFITASNKKHWWDTAFIWIYTIWQIRYMYQILWLWNVFKIK